MPVTCSTAPSRRSAAAQRRQRVEHHPGVVGVEQVVHRGRALREPGQQQHAVGDALAAGQPDRAGDAAQRRQVEVGDVEHRDRVRRGLRVNAGRARFTSAPCRSRRCAVRPSASWRGPRRERGSGPRAHRRSLRGSHARARRAHGGNAATASAPLRGWRRRMSRQVSGLLAAMRVKSRKPGPASDRKSRPAGWLTMPLK